MITLNDFGAGASVLASTPTIVAAWLVDFNDLGPLVDLDLSAIAKADTFSVAQPVIAVWYGSSPSSLAGATQLASALVAPTGNSFAPVLTEVTGLANPGGQRYLLVTGTQGAG